MAKSKTLGEGSDGPVGERAEQAVKVFEVLRSRPWMALVALASAAITGLAGFASGLDTIGAFIEKYAGWVREQPLLPDLLNQSEVDCVRTDHACQVDLWLRNPSERPLYLTGLSLRVVSVEADPILGKIEPSAVYQVDLTGLSRRGMTRRIDLYQEIGPQKSDRVRFLFGARDLHDRFRRWRLAATLETREGTVTLRPLEIALPWDSNYSAGPPVALPTPSATNP